MNSAEERFRKIEVLIYDYKADMDELDRTKRVEAKTMKGKYQDRLSAILEEYQE